jgi:hypothetical protein
MPITPKKTPMALMMTGFIALFMVSYWVFDVVLEVYVFKNSDLFTSLFKPDKMCLAMRLINLPIIVTFGSIALWMYIKRIDALAEINTLRGIIPICSYCHQIRDKEGIWNQLEAYILEHADHDAAFSHGVCPKCYEKEMEKIKKDV